MAALKHSHFSWQMNYKWRLTERINHTHEKYMAKKVDFLAIFVACALAAFNLLQIQSFAYWFYFLNSRLLCVCLTKNNFVWLTSNNSSFCSSFVHCKDTKWAWSGKLKATRKKSEQFLICLSDWFGALTEREIGFWSRRSNSIRIWIILFFFSTTKREKIVRHQNVWGK